MSASEINSDAYSLTWHPSDIIYVCLAVRLGIRKFIKERLRMNCEKSQNFRCHFCKISNPVKSNLKILFEIVFTSFAGVLSEFFYVLAAVEQDFQLKLIFKSQFCIAF